MELTFNLIWLLLTIGATSFWLARGAHTRPGRHPKRVRMFIGATALLCAVTLLLPVISITDDLHADQATAVLSSDLDIFAHKWRPSRYQHTDSSRHFVLTASGLLFTSSETCQSMPEESEVGTENLCFVAPTRGRSPPAVPFLS